MSTRGGHALIEETRVRGRVKPLFFMGILLGLVFAAGGGSFGRSNAEAAAPTLVTRSAAAIGSARTGARIAFSCHREGLGWQVCVMNADGSGQRNLTRNGGFNVDPSWSPDGRRIAFASDRDNGNREVYVMNASGGDQRRLTRTKGGGGSSNPAWSPDGQWIAFASNPEGNSDVYVINADGSGLLRLTRRWDFDGTPVWSPDGRRIAFTSWHRGNDDVYVMNADGTGRRNLTRNAADDHVHAGGWSPDGRRIVFASDRGGDSDIYVMNADGSGQRNLTRNPAADLFAAWSPDGTQIAFTRRRGEEIPNIYVMNTDGSGQRNLTGNRGGGRPAWSPLPRSALATSARATPTTLHRPTYARELQKLADRNSGAAVAIVVTPERTWKGAAGWADFQAKRRAEPDDRFAIESTTKTFVATVVMQLVGERRLDLHDTVQQWLPGLFPARPRITIRQLLNHSSGIPSDFGISEPPLVRVKRIAAQGCCLFPPGTSSAYSNSDFVLLGLIVEKVTGRPLDQVVTNRIIRRLHLRGTSYGTEHAQRMTPWLGPVESFGRPVSGDGGIISTVEDLATFFRALLGGNLLAPKQLAEMTGTIATDRPDLRYGLGIWRYRIPCGFAWGHGGLASYQVDVEVARDGSKAVVWAVNNPAPSDWSFGDRLYCA